MSRAARLAVAALAAIVLAGCASDPSQGYSFASTFEGGSRTVAVDVFKNATFAHGVEVVLADAIVKEIQRTTPWRVVDADQAETVLTGEIRAVRTRPLATSRRTGLVLESLVELSVNFDWRKTGSRELLVARRDLRALESHVPARGTSERVDVAENAAVQEMARMIVAELRSGW